MLGNAVGVLPTSRSSILRGVPLHDLLVRGGEATSRERRNSDDRAYNWSHVDGVARQISELDIPLLFTIVSMWRWQVALEGPKRRRRCPTSRTSRTRRASATTARTPTRAAPCFRRSCAGRPGTSRTADASDAAVEGRRQEAAGRPPVLLRQVVGARVCRHLPWHPERDLAGARGGQGSRDHGAGRRWCDCSVRARAVRRRPGSRRSPSFATLSRSASRSTCGRTILIRNGRRTRRPTVATTSTCKACRVSTPR